MTPSKHSWAEVKQAVEDALPLPAEARASRLAETCPDPLLRAEVERLLRACERAASSTFLDGPAAEFAAPIMTDVIEQERNHPAALQVALAGRYSIVRPLGQGGMATVYLARDERHHRLVALKVVHAELARIDSPLLGAMRFQREIEIAAQLTHPHILPLHDSGAEVGFLYYTMPYVEGETLRDRIARSGPQPIDVTRRILRDVARALAHAHRHGVIHCDIKPANILLNQDGDALIADFGVARALAAVSSPAAYEAATPGAPGFVFGTAAYMAPEQAAGDPASDHRADLFSLGVVAYELLTGALPFTRVPHRELRAPQRSVAPEPVASRRPDVAPAVDALVMQLLAWRPEERPQSAAEVLLVLEDAMLDSSRQPASGPHTRAGSWLRATRAWSTPRHVAAMVVLLGGGAGMADHGAPGAATAAEATAPSLAVLAFVNGSGNAAADHISDGLTDELISALSTVEGLTVAPRASTLALQTTGLDVAAIADSLGVATVLQGSVRRADNRLEVNSQLIRARDNRLLWSETYHRERGDLRAVQDDILRATAAALKVPLSARDSSRLLGTTGDVEAYDLYLRGRHSWKLRTKEGLEQAVVFYEQAVERDHRFAIAYAGLAEAYINLSNYGHRATNEALARARIAADRAVAIEPRLAEAHASQGYVLTSFLDFVPAEAAFRRAIALNPNYTWVRHHYSLLLMMLGRTSEALEQNGHALALDPLSLPANVNRGVILCQTGDYAGARLLLERALTLAPSFPLRLHYLGVVRASAGAYDEALALLQQAALQAPGFPGVPGALAYVYQRTGRQQAADSLLADLQSRTGDGRARANLALAHAALGHIDIAFPLLDELAWDVPSLIELRTDPLLKLLRSDVRYAQLLRRIGANGH